MAGWVSAADICFGFDDATAEPLSLVHAYKPVSQQFPGHHECIPFVELSRKPAG
jgi:hypothetical protein